MRQALRKDEVDVCVILTEGIIADIVKGSPTKIISHYINSPLIWGVHTAATNALDKYADIYDKNYAISRFGSGSHLMAIVDAVSNDRKLNKEQFIPIQSLSGALDSLASLETDVFYWEKFMTKPFVDDGRLKRLGEFMTPWPSFVIASRNDYIEKDSKVLKDMLEVIRFNSVHFQHSPLSVSEVVNRFELQHEDAEQWFESTLWNGSNDFQTDVLVNVQIALKEAGIIDQEVSIGELLIQL
ncbi:MAG: uracil-DNA glycosylase [Bacteroidota bacterium]